MHACLKTQVILIDIDTKSRKSRAALVATLCARYQSAFPKKCTHVLVKCRTLKADLDYIDTGG